MRRNTFFTLIINYSTFLNIFQYCTAISSVNITKHLCQRNGNMKHSKVPGLFFA
jgi:hypothetical protein